MHQPRAKSGFSLVELIIVVIVVGILAAVATPIYYKNMEKAIRAEAIAGIGSILVELRIAYGVDGRFPISPTYKKVVGQAWNDIQAGELTGKYFRDKNYKYLSLDGIAYRVRCAKNGVLEKNVWVDETGRWKFDTDVVAGDEE